MSSPVINTKELDALLKSVDSLVKKNKEISTKEITLPSTASFFPAVDTELLKMGGKLLVGGIAAYALFEMVTSSSPSKST